MKPINNFETVQASTGEFNRPKAGGYICVVTLADDCPLNQNTGKGDYLKIEYDISDGEFKNYYTEQYERFGGNFWSASFIRSYKETALGMFKHFINCIEESNIGYKWNWDEKTLQGKFIGLVIGEEEYWKNDGTIGTRMYVKNVKTVEQIKHGDFKVPELKKLDGVSAPTSVPVGAVDTDVDTDDDLPF